MRKLVNKKDKRGFLPIVIFFLIMFTILIIGFIGVIVVTLFDYTSGVITPITEGLGTVGNTNLSQASQYTFGTIDTTLSAFPWLLLFSYVAMLIFSIIFMISYRYNPNPAYIGIYFLFVVLLIFGAIIISNLYQDILSTNDAVVGAGLRSQTSMSFMILHSPWILGMIAFLVGIYIFTGSQRDSTGEF